MTLRVRSWLTFLIFSVLCSGCGGRAYVYEPAATAAMQDRAESQSDKSVTVSAAVPGRDETAAIFGIELYDQGIQPVWLEIENNGSEQVRYALVSTDSDYFSPLEVAYKNRGGYSDEARVEMERRFSELAMPRYIDPGETRSGFVFTHSDNGAKGINVDLFSSERSFHFTYLLRVPGFVPDYANIDFDSIYPADQLASVDEEGLRAEVENLMCCSVSEEGDRSGAINVVLVGAGEDLLRALLRSRWIETSAAEAARKERVFFYGRLQDAIFRHESRVDDSTYELRLWLAPVLSDTDRVWIGEVRHLFGSGAPFLRADPDADYARNFMLQSLIYGQSLNQIAWVAGTELVPIESFWERLIPTAFFTDGDRAVLWLSAEPFSIAEVSMLDWASLPSERQ